MFFKLALRNIKRSFKDYAIYFFTLVLGVAIFYVFNAIDSQTVMLGLSDYMLEVVKLMNGVLAGVSIFVALVLGFLIIYASRFLIKRRSQEFGIYMTLGMGKRRIAMIILLETLLIGVVSLSVGLLIGVGLSQFTSTLVASMFEADMTQFHFVFSSEACIKTLMYFAIIFMVVMLLDTVMVARQRLIKLLQARRMTETVKIRKTWLAIIVLAIGIMILAWAYSMVTVNVAQLNDGNIILVLAAGALGTILFFWSIATIVVKILSKTNFYNRGLNTFVLRQFSSAINTSVVALTMICLMLFVTICVSVSAISMHETIIASADKTTPIDIEYMSEMSDGIRTADFLRENYDIDLLAVMSEYREYEVEYGDFTYGDVLSDSLISAELQNLIYFDSPIPAMHVSDYNALSELFHNERVDLTDDQYAIVANFKTMVGFYNQSLAAGTRISLYGKTFSPAYDQTKKGAYQLSGTADTNTGLLVVPDNVKMNDARSQKYVAGNFHDNVDPKTFADKIEKVSNDMLANRKEYVSIELKQAVLDSNIGMNAIVTFVALYLGIIFLIASAALLALKQLTESSDNRAKYAIIQKIGASEKMINRALACQIGIFFALPLVVAIIHASFGIVFCDYVLKVFGGIQVGSSVIGTGLVFLMVYGGYFWITYATSKRMIRERRIQ